MEYHLLWKSSKSVSLSVRHRHPPGSGSRCSQRCLHPDGHHLRPGRDRGLPHGVGSHPRSALAAHVCHQRHLRLVFSPSGLRKPQRNVCRSMKGKVCCGQKSASRSQRIKHVIGQLISLCGRGPTGNIKGRVLVGTRLLTHAG